MQANQRRDFSPSQNHISSLLHLRLLTVFEAQLHLARPSVSQLAAEMEKAADAANMSVLFFSADANF